MKKIEDGLSAEDLANIARLSFNPIYRVYFNLESGEILALSNEDRPEYDHSIIISYEQYEAFVTGRENFKDWLILNTKNLNNIYGVELVQRVFQGHTFKNNMFEWIIDPPTKSTDLVVHWDEYNKHWIFIISDSVRQRFYDGKITTPVVKFFITLQNDFDFLIRTIEIELTSLIADKVIVPFESNLESQLDRISISSRTVFDSYGLKIWKIKKK
jgi:hypothetical protein